MAGMKEQLWTMSGHDFLDIVRFSNKKTGLEVLTVSRHYEVDLWCLTEVSI